MTVADNGAGMEPAEIERIFDMFTQARTEADRSQGGLGIGLALVKSIVELHGGRVEASSSGRGKGCEFRVILPNARAAAQAPVVAPRPAPAAAAADSSRSRGSILIADGNADAGWGMAKLLEMAGFKSVLVRSGREALAEARRLKPDVGILDISMPQGDGYEVARQLRATDWGRRMVLIAVTGWGHTSDERDALAAGFDAHMAKPIDMRMLDAAVDGLLQRRRE